MAPSTGDGNQLKASYTSPSESKSFEFPLSVKLSKEPNTTAKTEYLSELRSNTKKLQASINVFLTQKMEEDKAKTAQEAVDSQRQNGKAKDEEEEENYGEEKIEDED